MDKPKIAKYGMVAFSFFVLIHLYNYFRSIESGIELTYDVEYFSKLIFYSALGLAAFIFRVGFGKKDNDNS